MMKKQKFTTLLVLFFTTFAFANQNDKITINVAFTKTESYPYILGEGKNILSNNPGLAIEAMKSLEKKLNIKFNFIREPWDRQKRKLQYNKLDMLFVASYKKSREKIGVYPTKKDGSIDTEKSTVSSSYVIYKLKDSKLDWDGEKFINLTGDIITQKGYSIVKFLNKKGIDVIENRADTDLKKLLLKRVEGVARHNNEFGKYFKENPQIAKQIVKLPIPLVTKPYYIISSHKFYKNNSALVNKIWDELTNLDNDNKFKDLRDKY